MRTRPLQALRPPAELAPCVASPPYDVVSPDEARAIGDAEPASFMHVVRPEIDFPPGTDPYDARVYEQGRANLERFRREGWLVRAGQPSYYLYRQQAGQHVQAGWVCLCHIGDYETDLIKKHEKTLAKKEADRTRHVRSLMAHTGPVFMTFRDQDALGRISRELQAGTPLYDFELADGVRHTVWEVSASAGVGDALAGVPYAYIADGHHRAASAFNVGHELRRAAARYTGEESYNWFLSVLFPAGELNILAYNRVVRDLAGRTPEAFLAACEERFGLVRNAGPVPSGPGRVAVYAGEGWHQVELPEGAPGHAAAGLDAARLQEHLLGPLLGIEDPKTDPRISFVGGIRGTDDLARRVDTGAEAAAFSLYPTSIEQLMAVADAGECMPPKSTWFEPKLLSGLLVNTIHPDS